MDRSQVAILIPAFNEAATIKDVLNSINIYGIPIIIDDGSSDNTSEIAIAAGAITIKHITNLGYDSALISGFQTAIELNFNYCVTFDADGQHNSNNIKELLYKIVSENAVISLGNRKYKQRFSEYIFSFVTYIRYGINDPLCGLKAYDLKIYKELGYFDSYKSVGTELLLYALSKRKKIVEIDIDINRRIDSSRFYGSLRANFIIIRSMIIGFSRYM